MTATLSKTPVLEEGLQKVPREFKFHPSTVTNPEALTREQVRAYNEEGFIKPLDALGAAEITAARDYFDRLLKKTQADGKDSYSINGWQTKYRALYNLARHPRIVAYARDILGPNVVCWGTHFFCKLPGDPKTVAWHQDGSYWPLSPTKTVTAWLAIDDADAENGCMRFIPRSHLHGHIEYRFSDKTEDNVLWQTVPNAESFGTPVNDELKAGQLSLHSDLTLHGSLANLSRRRRCGLTIRYASTDVKTFNGWNQNSIICSGVDPDGHWANIPMPAEE